MITPPTDGNDLHKMTAIGIYRCHKCGTSKEIELQNNPTFSVPTCCDVTMEHRETIKRLIKLDGNNPPYLTR